MTAPWRSFETPEFPREVAPMLGVSRRLLRLARFLDWQAV
jgi:hypothetical protein